VIISPFCAGIAALHHYMILSALRNENFMPSCVILPFLSFYVSDVLYDSFVSFREAVNMACPF